VLIDRKKDNDKWAEPSAHIGDQEVQPVERWCAKIFWSEPRAYAATSLVHGLHATAESGRM
jgi:hypothetical protein